MPFNGTGTYGAPASSWNPAVVGTTINQTDWNALLADISTNGLSFCLTKDGQTTATAEIPFVLGISLGTAGSVMGTAKFSGSTSGTTTLQPTAAASGTLTLPAATDTLVGKATTDTLTNKTLTAPVLTTPVLGTPASGNLANCTGYPGSAVSGVVGAANGGTGVANNAASTITISGNFGTTLTVSNTTAVTLPVTGTLATLAGSEELTNKTLTSSVAKGTWTASGTWTLPAHTLGGTVTLNGQTFSGAAVFSAGATFGGALSGITTLAGSGAVSGFTTANFSGLVTASSGITFGGTTLSTYTDTTWTPTIAGSSTAGTQTYSVQVGTYTRVGNTIFAFYNITLSALDGATAGGLYIGGLPVAVVNTSNLDFINPVGGFAQTTFSSGTWMGARPQHGQSNAYLIVSGSGVAGHGLLPAEITSTFSVQGWLIYKV